jgi:thiamine transporter ThiT
VSAEAELAALPVRVYLVVAVVFAVISGLLYYGSVLESGTPCLIYGRVVTTCSTFLLEFGLAFTVIVGIFLIGAVVLFRKRRRMNSGAGPR